MTSIVSVVPDNISLPDIGLQHAAELIKTGELVAFPTETVYGLGANAFDANAVGKIFRAKGRPATDPVIVHVHQIEQVQEVAVQVPVAAQALMAQFWPGPLTLVLRRSAKVPANVSAGLPTVGVRVPAHPVALALIKAAGVPIAAPSANLFSHTSPTTAQHVLKDLNGRVALILDGGPTTVGVESTIVDLTGERPRLLRPGGTPIEALHTLLPDLEVISHIAHAEDGAVPAPGMLLKHYSPRAEVRLFDGPDTAGAVVCDAIAKTIQALRQEDKRPGLMLVDEDAEAILTMLGKTDLPLVMLGSLNDLSQIARRLFAGLRALDDQQVDVIVTRMVPSEGIGLAVRDRLLRAAEGHVIYVAS